ncbi:probable disease resistance protein At1g12290 [Camellia sinensis]|uniref:probable disease resistance protein At1g12290 n=1 Tax=Camellia sinensis TaxID=4442 RepID=UPI001035A81E|nr:probable disease resistance protein At1g12290 [Camellia sinensis]
MEVHLAIPPQDLLTVLDVPKPKGAGAATSSTILTISIPVSASIPRVTRATSKKGTSQGDSPQKIQDQQKKRRPLLEPEKEVFEVQAEEEEEEEEEEAEKELTQEQESPLKRRKRVAVPSSSLVQDLMHETMVRVEELTSEEFESQTGEKGVEEKHSRPAQRKRRRKMTVSPSDFVGDPIHKAAAKRLELNDIGIPFGDNHKGCKIVMTSRNKDVCNSMGTHENFEIGVLHKEEAWNLFKEMAEISDEGTSHSTGLQLTQMAVAKECGGLPIAIATVGRALRCKNKYSWDSALEQLRKSLVKNISGVDEKVFKSLELSYDSLDSDEAKKCFLLCSLYPEDFDIPIEDLVRYAIGIELFERIDSVHQARNRVHSLVDDLKKCYLLMENKNEEYLLMGSKNLECIKMHDVVRDVAISIASREEHSIVVRCDEVLKEWPKKDRLEKKAIISLKVDGMHGLPGNLEFPNLHLLKLDCNAGLLPISLHDLNKGMEEVKVQETLDL